MPAPEQELPSTDRRDRSSNRQPLYIRMYFSAMMTELVRLVGYCDVPVDEVREKLTPLFEKYGKQAIMDACEELLDVDTSMQPPVARLNAEVRKLAFQMLGPPPKDRPAVGTASVMKTCESAAPTAKPSAPTRKPRREKLDSAVLSPATTSTSRILQQFRDAKERHPNMLLLFRMGDCYRIFEQDAETAATLLGLVLARRDENVVMTSFPQHQLEPFLQKLLKEGHRVAICDEAEIVDPAHALGGEAGGTMPDARPEETSTPVNMPRYHVMAKFEENLAANQVQFSTAKELRKGMPFLAMLPAIDYVVVRGQMRLCVTVRPSLRGNQAAQLIALQDAVLANCAAVRIWPVEGPSGWKWKEHELFAGPLGIDPERFKLSLDDWRAVHEHCDGDKNCGRDWLTEGCVCACCRAARSFLATRTAKSRTRK